MYLRERAECVELLNKERATNDSLYKINGILSEENRMQSDNVKDIRDAFNAAMEGKDNAFAQLSDCNAELIETGEKLDKEKRRKKSWRTVAIVSTASVIGLIFLSIKI